MNPSVKAWMQTAFPPRAITYLHAAASGVVSLPLSFRGAGPLLAYSVPPGESVTAFLMPPTGPMSLGNPPQATLTMAAASDVVVMQL
jgi:hypothetical protein